MKAIFAAATLLVACLAPRFAVAETAGYANPIFPIPALLAQTQDPLEDEQAVQDRLEAGSPGETALSENNNSTIMSIFLILMLLLLVGAIFFVRRRSKVENRHDPDTRA